MWNEVGIGRACRDRREVFRPAARICTLRETSRCAKLSPMTLSEFKAQEGLTLTALASLLGCKVTTVHGWVNGTRRPGWDAVAAIEEKTKGRVTASDFVPRTAMEAV